MRLAGYVRVSRVAGREGDSFISPALQREQIAALAKARGHEIIEWIEDLDESGGKWERPGFQRVLQMVETGEADGIAVAKLDRFARSVKDALSAIERIEAAGGELISVADNLDTTTAIGRAMLKIILVFAELERERQRESFRDSVTRAIGRGIHISTLVPTGYKRGPDRRLLPDAHANTIRQVFLRRASGESWASLARFLDKQIPREGAWTKTTIAKLVRNRAYLGEAHQGKIVNPDAHKPIVSRAEFEAAQSEAAAPRAQRSGSLLSGILACASCGGPLTRKTANDYGCRARRSNGVCLNPVTVTLGRADAYVEQVFLDWAREQTVTLDAAQRDDDLQTALERLEAVETELALYRDTNLVSVIGREAYVAGLHQRALEVDDARKRLADAHTTLPLSHYDAASIWPELSTREKRALIESVIEKVVVSSSTSRTPVSERLLVVWHTPKDELRVAGA